MCSFFNTVDFNHPPQSPLYFNPHPKELQLKSFHLKTLDMLYSQAEHVALSGHPELQTTSSLVDNILKLAFLDLQSQLVTQGAPIEAVFNILSTSFANILREYAYQLNTLFFINGKIDIGLSAQAPLPPILKDFSLLPEQERKLTTNLNRLKKLFETGRFPIVMDKGTPLILHHKNDNTLPRPMSAYISTANDPAPYPFLDIIIDNKATGRELNTVQMLSYLYAQLASQARYRQLDEPSIGLGAITNAYQWTFMIYQLNTLNFDHTGPRNIVWYWNESMSLGQNPDLSPYFTLKKFMSVAVKTSLETRGVNDFTQS